MSKLGDRIRKTGKTEPAPLGFATAAAKAAAASMFIVVDAGDEAAKIADAAKKGADAVIWEGNAAALRKARLPEGVILGVRVKDAGREEAAALREAGADFLVIDHGTRGEALLDEKLGFVMVIEEPAKLEDSALRLVGELSLDALLVAPPKAPFSVADVLALRRIASLARAPMFATVDPAMDAGTLQLLRESGVIALQVAAADAGGIADLKNMIASLPERGRKREDKSEALVPAQAMAGGHDDDDDDDD
jgi:hypothetical protein